MKPKLFLNPALRFLFLFSFLTVFNPTSFSQNCNTWLNVKGQPSLVRVGDLDISGNKLTVEALINRTAPWSGADVWQGDVVSKHEDFRDCNYLLRPSSAEITTTNGYFKTPTICPIELNKTYHVAMVYDGSVLKFYRNGYLMSQINASGNLYQNDWQTQIGLYFNGVTQEQFVGYINEVRIWNIARTQSEIKSTMGQSLISPQSIHGLLAYYTFDNLINKQGNTKWNGSLIGSSSINQTNTNCSFVADSCGINKCINKNLPEFSFQQDVCNPNIINFNTNLNDIKSYEWDFGDGHSNNGNSDVSNEYAILGNYQVKLKVIDKEGCTIESIKSINLNIINDDIIKTQDTSICLGDSINILRHSGGYDYCWKDLGSRNTFLNTELLVKPDKSTNFKLTQKLGLNNLVVNGDFSSGNTSFFSDYTFSTQIPTEGSYAIGKNGPTLNSSLQSCKDHTSGNGNMLMVNGSTSINKKVWMLNINVKPNTNYIFSTWIQSLTTESPAQLQLYINGIKIGGAYNSSSESCNWKQFYTTWNSGQSPIASIALVDINQSASGNDFALDDLFFGEAQLKQEIFHVIVNQLPEVKLGSDLVICKGESKQLNAVVSNNTTIKWSPDLYLSNSFVTNPFTTPTSDIQYLAKATSTLGCIKEDTILIKVINAPVIDQLADKIICRGNVLSIQPNVTNATSFSWQPISGVNNPSSKNTTITPTANTTYFLIASNEACNKESSFKVVVNPLPTIEKSNDTIICIHSNVQLNIKGGIKYEWVNVPGLSNYNIPNPLATPSTSTNYIVNVTDLNGCVSKDSIKVEVEPIPLFKVEPSKSNICYGDTLKLAAAGGNEYIWSPQNSLNNPNNAETLAFPVVNTNYKVVIKNTICNMIDSSIVTIIVNQLPEIKVSKDRDIDCANNQAQLIVSGGNSYKWFPETGLSDPSIFNPIATPGKTTSYFVQGTTVGGCTSIDSVVVNVTKTGDKKYYVPSAFTPNRDGKNDCFGIKDWGNVKDYSMQIFNRWGERIFVSNNISDCWNGKYNGVDQPVGVYVFLITANSSCGPIQKKGMFTLIR